MLGLDVIVEKVFEYLERMFPFTIVDQFEHAILMRNGKKVKQLRRGFHFFPLKLLFIDNVLTVLKERDTFSVPNVNITTIDGKTISIGVIVEYSVVDPDKFLLQANDAITNARDITRGVAADYLTDCNWEDVKKKTTLTQIKNKLRNHLDEIGIDVNKVLFGDIVVSRVFTIFNN
jgi:regulator of protease activity HflC (stomatin/prohibitin superfamily)